jgi:hypothetical protein
VPVAQLPKWSQAAADVADCARPLKLKTVGGGVEAGAARSELAFEVHDTVTGAACHPDALGALSAMPVTVGGSAWVTPTLPEAGSTTT